MLDGIRGVAALAVMFFHLYPHIPGGMLGHGYLAVDLFFLLSGFVISYTYENRLTNGWPLGRFALARAIRLYPLVVAAVFSVVLLRSIYPHPVWPSAQLLGQATLNAALIPNFFSGAPDQFPIVGPSWSLFFEIVVNLVYAAFLPAIRKKSLYIIMALSGLALFAYTYRDGSVGLLHHDFLAGMTRTTFSFFAGVWIFRNIQIISRFRYFSATWLYYLTIIVFLCTPILSTGNWAFDIFCIVVAFPIITASAISSSVAGGGDRYSGLLGELSYPIYVLHMPLAAYVGVGLGWLISGSILATVTALLTVVASFVAWKAYDQPIRRWLNARVGRQRATPALRAEP